MLENTTHKLFHLLGVTTEGSGRHRVLSDYAATPSSQTQLSELCRLNDGHSTSMRWLTSSATDPVRLVHPIRPTLSQKQSTVLWLAASFRRHVERPHKQ